MRYADVILLNKTDRMDETARQRVEMTLRQLNPGAEIAATERGVIEPDHLSAAGPRRALLQKESDSNCCGHHHGEHEHDESCEAGHDHEHAHHHEHDHDHDHALPHSASTFFLPLSGPVERDAFQRFLGALPTTVFRAKGFVRFNDSPGQVHTFQQVREQAELLVLPLDDAPDVATGLVFIGPQLDEAHIRELAAGLTAGRALTS